MNLSECFRKGLLKYIEPDIIKAKEALVLANHYLERAEGNIECSPTLKGGESLPLSC